MTSLTITEQIITVAMVVLGTMITRFLPFLIFPADKTPPRYVQYLGRFLPAAVFGLLVVYCLRNVNFLTGALRPGISSIWARPCRGLSSACWWSTACEASI